MCGAVYKLRFEVSIFFKFWIFPFVLGQILNYLADFSLFWVDFPNQYLLELLNFFFFLKTRVIKLLIIYLILIYIYGVVWCGVVWCTITCDA